MLCPWPCVFAQLSYGTEKSLQHMVKCAVHVLCVAFF